MMDITSIMNIYRECVRNLWNVYLRERISELEEWDERDKFEDICDELFTLMVLCPISKVCNKKALGYEEHQEPLSFIKVVPSADSGVPIYISREKDSSKYWDHPVNFIKPQDVELLFIDFFDFDVLGFRDFEFYRVRIVEAMDEDLIGRDALVRCKNVNVFLREGKDKEQP